MIEFVSYEASSPWCWCRGVLTLKINGRETKLENCLQSGGHVSWADGEDIVEEGPWIVHLPESLEKYHDEIERLVNDNVEWGCCGGCI